MSYININNLTKDYGKGRGNFDVNLTIEKGEVFGFAGINGAGKTTLIRQLMGFLKPSSGYATINHLNCWEHSAEIKKLIGYIPGEIAFPDAPTGTEFLRRQAELVGLTDMSYAEALIKKLQLDPTANLKRMSKGMKQKTAIVAAMMHDPNILIFDEPTTGLDPLMRVAFIDIMKDEIKKGKTIFMSSHMWDEMEAVCNRVALIKDGKIVAVQSVKEVKHNKNKVYHICFRSEVDYERFQAESLVFGEKFNDELKLAIHIKDKDVRDLFKIMKNYDVKSFVEFKLSLEENFKKMYD